jgi:simple sugar transport system permease protein
VALPLCLLAGALAGGLLGALPGALRAWRGAHEVINTIMLNFIVAALALWAGNAGAFVGETTSTAAIVEGARLPNLGFAGSAVSASFFLALLAAAGVWFFLARTRAGFRWRAVGGNPGGAENAGIRVQRTYFWAMTVSGVLAGLAASNWVLGYKHHFEEGLGRNTGYMGIAVALLGRTHPVGIVAAALLFGVLSEGGLAASELVPKELVEVLQAVIILAIAATLPASREMARRVASARAPSEEVP